MTHYFTKLAYYLKRMKACNSTTLSTSPVRGCCCAAKLMFLMKVPVVLIIVQQLLMFSRLPSPNSQQSNLSNIDNTFGALLYV